jgi:hypothetical protein
MADVRWKDKSEIALASGDRFPVTDVSASNTDGYGEIGKVGTGKKTIWVPASAMTPRTTNGPTLATRELATNDIMLTTLDFDASTSQGAGFWISMPKSWNEGTVTFVPFWTSSSGISGTVIWSLAGYSFSDNDAMDTAVSGTQTSTDTFLAQDDLHVGPESSAITIGGTPAAGDSVYFEISRNISDTLDDYADLIGVHIYITTNVNTDD